MAGQGSRHHAALDARRWAKARKAALERAGWRSELSGLRGRLEVHHRVKLEDGGAPYDLDNLIVLTRDEHIRLHRDENMTPEQLAWDDAVRELLRRAA
ncbi:MAG: HNH endonuclease signature motif containing protein [Rhodospirillales bacterium]|nr:HNH endonuclease signature motif containing protein [Rhodospirillales bacterium]